MVHHLTMNRSTFSSMPSMDLSMDIDGFPMGIDKSRWASAQHTQGATFVDATELAAIFLVFIALLHIDISVSTTHEHEDPTQGV
jgi:hypothetical protein